MYMTFPKLTRQNQVLGSSPMATNEALCKGPPCLPETRKLNGLWDTVYSACHFWQLRNKREKTNVKSSPAQVHMLTNIWENYAWWSYKPELWAVNEPVHIIIVFKRML